MSMKKISLAACFAAIIFLIITTVCIRGMSDGNKPVVKNGQADLSSWDFDEKGGVRLSGEWEFYWEKLLYSDDFKIKPSHTRVSYIDVPSIWNGHVVNGKNVGGEGFATYIASIKLPEGMETVYLKAYDMSSAYRIYADGTLIGKNGDVSADRDMAHPEFNPQIVKFNRENEWVEIIVQVSNYSHYKGGFWESIIIGNEKSVEAMNGKSLMANFFVMGFIVSMAIYHMVIASLIRKEKAFLFFSVFCILMSIRIFITGERCIVDLFENTNWETLQKIEYLSFYMMLPVFIRFIDYLFECKFSRAFLKTVYAFSFIFSIIVLVFPAKAYTRTLSAYHVLIIISGIYVIRAIVSAVRDNINGAQEFSVGFFGFFAAVLVEIVSVQKVLGYQGTLFWGMIFFILMISIAISKQFSAAVIDTEKLALEKEKMVEKVNELNEKLKRRNSDLVNRVTRDGLSGLYNHRHIHEKLAEKAIKANMYGSCLSIGMFDIDRFKDVNDNYGHQFGDKVIVEVARILSENTRNSDAVGRYGGEEFIVIFDGADENVSFEVSERLRIEVEKQIVKNLGVRVTISGGVTELENEECPTNAIRRADELLYRAKRNGRNRIERSMTSKPAQIP
ncbi:diguanylate cyclase (GGDEF) domain-containing protein [Peptoclostridium litorale DSM 5388]|uniref:Diguanylate cyclase DosC n=2 Tax=Peptoclostridium litorale TaxID=1557 RepID=A0A069RKS4_PEPLI|nr:diguanylate cyclase DosC [Peptoclostridium litorale DSM 5388]SIN67355.1 diguanylate cyclase (GGDEF) domain-containing protein [Peptoclostridium litorale DSM 5388]